MTLPEVLGIIALVIVLGGAIGYIVYSKRRGKGCIGCSGGCSGNCASCPSCKQKHE